MKTKNINLSTKKANQRHHPNIKVVRLANSKSQVLHHLKLVEHKHTGRLVHRQHTSYISLMLLLLAIGFFMLYASSNIALSEQMPINNSTTVDAIVSGPVPTIGATITLPANSTTLTDIYVTDINGTCLKNTFVVIDDNSGAVGSTVCTDAGIFTLQIKLKLGANILSALNYDNLNQAGPVTPSVNVNVVQTNGLATESTMPNLPVNPSIISGSNSNLSDCSKYNPVSMPISSEPHVAIVCVPRLFGPKTQQAIGLLAWGGSPPYAVDIDWGDNLDNTLLSLPTAGYKTQTFSYAAPNTYKILLKLTDQTGKTAIVQTAVQVNGSAKATASTSIVNEINNIDWFKTPVPLYLLAVAITLGFWGGDIFNRKFGSYEYRRKTRTAT
jgi:hypothetical protein